MRYAVLLVGSTMTLLVVFWLGYIVGTDAAEPELLRVRLEAAKATRSIKQLTRSTLLAMALEAESRKRRFTR